jgi:hypothetical protein
MSAGEFPREVQSQAVTIRGGLRIGPVKSFKKMRRMLPGYAGSVVRDGYRNRPCCFRNADADAAAFPVIFHRVVEQVEEDLREASAIKAGHRAVCQLCLELDAARLGHDPCVPNTLGDDFAHSVRAQIELQSPGICAGEEKQAFGNGRKLASLLQQHSQGALIFRGKRGGTKQVFDA